MSWISGCMVAQGIERRFALTLKGTNDQCCVLELALGFGSLLYSIVNLVQSNHIQRGTFSVPKCYCVARRSVERSTCGCMVALKVWSDDSLWLLSLINGDYTQNSTLLFWNAVVLHKKQRFLKSWACAVANDSLTRAFERLQFLNIREVVCQVHSMLSWPTRSAMSFWKTKMWKFIHAAIKLCVLVFLLGSSPRSSGGNIRTRKTWRSWTATFTHSRAVARSCRRRPACRGCNIIWPTMSR